MIEKLKNDLKEENISKSLKNNLFNEFNNSVKKTIDINPNHCKQDSTIDYIHKSVECTIKETVNHVINSNDSLLQSKNIIETIKSVENFIKNSNFGTFEYEQKTGRSFFRVEHSEGYTGTKFLKVFFERVFDICLKNYSFHIISNENYVCVMFR